LESSWQAAKYAIHAIFSLHVIYGSTTITRPGGMLRWVAKIWGRDLRPLEHDAIVMIQVDGQERREAGVDDVQVGM
jgi:hypothetical protein